MIPLRTIVIAAFTLLAGVPLTASAERLFCESRDYQQAFCPAGPRIARAWIVDQRSQAPCINGQTWGFQGNGIWVNAGCSAVFAFEPR